MKIDVILGLQWGDEGKGKIVDVLTPDYDIIARFQGGPNAGHTLRFGNDSHVLHTIPSGIFHKNTINVIGNGVIIDPFVFNKELIGLRSKGVEPSDNLLISRKTHLILPSHRLLDAAIEKSRGTKKIGSTLKGIGPAYTDKASRYGLRSGDLFANNFISRYKTLKNRHLKIIENYYNMNIDDVLLDSVNFKEYEEKWLQATENIKEIEHIDSEYYINSSLKNNKSILAEGAQGTLLDVDFGTYPFVTSSNTIASGVCTGLGVAPSKIGKVYGIVKAYTTRVGSGPFPTELFDDDGVKLRDQGREYGSTTGRPRRCGWLDLPAVKYAVMLNGITDLIITKIDVLSNFEKIKVCTNYDINNKKTDQLPFMFVDGVIKTDYIDLKGWIKDVENIKSIDKLPTEMLDYLKIIEKYIEVPVTIVSVGPDRKQTIHITDF